MSKNIAIEVKAVSKNFRLPHEKADSLKSVFINPFRKSGGSEVQHALKNISFNVEEGEFFGIVGRNGGGKSTLLKILAEIYKPNVGSVVARGKLVPFIELGVGFNPELTGRENVYLNGALLGFSTKEIDGMYDDIVNFAELTAFMDQKLKNYSSGMQVRLAFSVATRSKADILLIDEVLAVGDADFQRKCFEYFKQLKKDKKTVVFVSHDMSAVREYCDRAILIDESKIVFTGNADDVAKEYTKLFQRDIYNAEENARKKRDAKKAGAGLKWGSGGVDIVDFKTSKQVYNQEDEIISISYTVVAESSFDDSINPGFTIKDEQGQSICGTNAKITGDLKTIRLNKNKRRINVLWTLPNIFSAGKYSIDPAILSMSTGETLQWWDDAAMFRIINEKTTPYPVSPKIELNIN